jgi:RNA polymerase sigma-54 factor
MRQARRTLKDRELEIAELIILNLEEDGYLTTSPEELANDEFGVQEIIEVSKKLQRFEPVGCACRNERETLLVQLEVLGYTQDAIEYVLVQNHFEDFKKNHYTNILKTLKIDEERLLKAKEVIMKLDPKPGWQCSSATSRYISPDFIVRWRDNSLVAQLNDENTPRVRVRRQYLEILKNPKNVPSEQLDFIRQRVQAAHNLIIAIEQRRRTLTRIIDNILDYQREFFEQGYNYLKPITMTEFAKQLNVNPSTISRAIANKYLESPWGIHQLKFFFNPPVSHTDKGIIFKKIKEIIDGEDKSSPLSDTQIAKQLSRQGIIISRRTVSKYRDILHVPAHQFRRE